jgi:hypothetical protein
MVSELDLIFYLSQILLIVSIDLLIMGNTHTDEKIVRN